MILADENLHQAIINALVQAGYKVQRVVDLRQGAPDEQVIELAGTTAAFLMTEDKDFGELVFAHQKTKVTVVFLRYRQVELQAIVRNVLHVVHEYLHKEGRYFIAISSTRIRIRSL